MAANLRTFSRSFCFNTLDNRSSTTKASLPLCNSFVLMLKKALCPATKLFDRKHPDAASCNLIQSSCVLLHILFPSRNYNCKCLLSHLFQIELTVLTDNLSNSVLIFRRHKLHFHFLLILRFIRFQRSGGSGRTWWRGPGSILRFVRRRSGWWAVCWARGLFLLRTD